MFPRTLADNAKKALESLSDQILRQFLLAGGTSLALQLGHRVSVDLDFITNKKFGENQLLEALAKLKGFSLKEKDWQTIHGNLLNTKISFLYQEGKLLAKPVNYKNAKLASIKDLSAMKLASISSRGAKRDFIDLYFICKETNYSLKDTLKFYQDKYQTNGSAYYHLLKSLVFFEDAEKDQTKLTLLKKASWEEVKQFFSAETATLSAHNLIRQES